MSTCEKCKNWLYPLTYEDGSVSGECYPRVMGKEENALTAPSDTCERFTPIVTTIDQLTASIRRNEGLSVRIP